MVKRTNENCQPIRLDGNAFSAIRPRAGNLGVFCGGVYQISARNLGLYDLVWASAKPYPIRSTKGFGFLRK